MAKGECRQTGMERQRKGEVRRTAPDTGPRRLICKARGIQARREIGSQGREMEGNGAQFPAGGLHAPRHVATP